MSDEKPSQMLGHLVELRQRLLITFIIMAIATGVSFVFAAQIYGFLVAPLSEAMKEGDSQRLIYTGLTEGFFTYLKVSFFAGIFITFPLLLWQIWAFIAPGLYKNERAVFWPFLIATPALFFLGGALVYYIVLPMAWPFFLGFQTTGAQTGLPIQLEARISEYLSLIMSLIFAFGLCFQIPVLLTLLGKAGVVSADWLAKQRKYVLILSFLIAAFITPPDVITQFMLALPMLLLYEISILFIRYGRFEKSDTRKSETVVSKPD